MANTCNNCSCKDQGLTTPCYYTNCNDGNERCDDVQCTECVSYCGTSFQIDSPSGLFKIESGERLDQIIQKMALMIVNGFGSCNANDLHHAPYNLYAETITDTTVNIVWGAVSSLSTSFSVYYDTVAASSGWTLANATPLATAITNFNIINLAPNTEYKIKVVSDFGGSLCDSVEILVTTLLAQ